ncbi:hypothetical protein FRB91_002666 [Serendipita sp. 411]|nr:hypothetical protein FRB91_002666 [Serendipita sp. 411]
MSSDTLTFADWDVTFTDGASVSNVKEHRTHTDIILKNLSSSITNPQLQAEIGRFGSASIMRDSRKKRARIRFLDPDHARAALVELDCKRLGPSRLEVTFDRSKDSQWIEDGILLVYDICQTTAEVSFASPMEATEALDLNRCHFHGKRIRVFKERDQEENKITVEDLPAQFEEEDLLTLFSGSCSVQIARDFGEEADFDSLLQSLIREQPGCATLHLLSLPSDVGRGAGWIRMFNDERAADVTKEVKGLRPIFLGGNVIQVRRAQAVVWKLSSRHYTAIESLLDVLKIDDIFYLTTVEPTEEIELRIVGADLRKLCPTKAEIDKIVNGEVWKTDGGGTLWDRHWVSEEGKRFIQEVNQVSAAFVQANMFERIITISGRQEAKDCAKLMLQDHLDELDQQRHLIKLPRETMDYFITHGLPKLRNNLYHFDSTIGRRQDIAFNGSDNARQQLHTVLDQCATEVSLRSTGGERPLCPVCTTEVTEPLSLECDHVYCSECVAHLITSAVDFPIECIVPDCHHTPSLRVLQRIVPPSQYRRMLQVAFRTYLRGNGRLFPCPTTDCPQLWMSNPNPTNLQVQCSTCLVRICTNCKCENHVGMNCEEYQRSKSYQTAERDMATWRRQQADNVKACPSCGTIVEKTDGCPHIHCLQCNSHWCWECARAMPRAELVYAHIRRRHIALAARFLAPVHIR